MRTMPLPNPAIKTPEGKSHWDVDENGPSLRHHFKKEPEGSQYCSRRLTKLEHQTELKFYHLSKFCCRDRVLWQGSHLTGVRCCLIFVAVRASSTICWSDPFHHRWPESEAFEFTLQCTVPCIFDRRARNNWRVVSQKREKNVQE